MNPIEIKFFSSSIKQNVIGNNIYIYIYSDKKQYSKLIHQIEQ